MLSRRILARYPELKLCPSDELRSKVWYGAFHPNLRNLRHMLVILLFVVLVSLAHNLCSLIDRERHPVLAWGTLLAAYSLVVLIFSALWQRQFRRALRAGLMEIGILVCLKCGRELQATPSEDCPNCSSERVARSGPG